MIVSDELFLVQISPSKQLFYENLYSKLQKRLSKIDLEFVPVLGDLVIKDWLFNHQPPDNAATEIGKEGEYGMRRHFATSNPCGDLVVRSTCELASNEDMCYGNSYQHITQQFLRLRYLENLESKEN